MSTDAKKPAAKKPAAKKPAAKKPAAKKPAAKKAGGGMISKCFGGMDPVALTQCNREWDDAVAEAFDDNQEWFPSPAFNVKFKQQIDRFFKGQECSKILKKRIDALFDPDFEAADELSRHAWLPRVLAGCRRSYEGEIAPSAMSALPREERRTP